MIRRRGCCSWWRGRGGRRGRHGHGAGPGARERGQRSHGVPDGPRASTRAPPPDNTAAAAGTSTSMTASIICDIMLRWFATVLVSVGPPIHLQ